MSAKAVATSTMRLQFDEFLSFLKETKNASENTVQSYKRDIARFSDYISEKGLVSYADVSRDEVDGFKTMLGGKGLSSASVSRALSAVRSMMQYYVFAGIMRDNPAHDIRNDKPKKPAAVVILSEKDMNKLLEQPDGDDPKSVRDRAMMELLYATGLKASELVGLNLSDVNLPFGYISCSAKGKERRMPLYAVAIKSLARYINSARKMLVFDPGEQALFVNFSGRRMTRQGLWKILKIHAHAAGIKEKITPLVLRNSFAAHLLNNGADIHEMQEILGHTDFSSTQRYAQFLKEYHQKSYVKFHPRA